VNYFFEKVQSPKIIGALFIYMLNSAQRKKGKKLKNGKKTDKKQKTSQNKRKAHTFFKKNIYQSDKK